MIPMGKTSLSTNRNEPCQTLWVSIHHIPTSRFSGYVYLSAEIIAVLEWKPEKRDTKQNSCLSEWPSRNNSNRVTKWMPVSRDCGNTVTKYLPIRNHGEPGRSPTSKWVGRWTLSLSHSPPTPGYLSEGGIKKNSRAADRKKGKSRWIQSRANLLF